jgi:hypothetical protein
MVITYPPAKPLGACSPFQYMECIRSYEDYTCTIGEVLEGDRTTTLTAWFESNGQNRDGHHLLYADYEEMFR